MAPVKRLLASISIIGAFSLVKLFPQRSINESFLATFFTLLSFQYTILFTWNVILYPKYFSPLRHLPEPTVRLILGHGRMEHAFICSREMLSSWASSPP